MPRRKRRTPATSCTTAQRSPGPTRRSRSMATAPSVAAWLSSRPGGRTTIRAIVASKIAVAMIGASTVRSVHDPTVGEESRLPERSRGTPVPRMVGEPEYAPPFAVAPRLKRRRATRRLVHPLLHRRLEMPLLWLIGRPMLRQGPILTDRRQVLGVEPDGDGCVGQPSRPVDAPAAEPHVRKLARARTCPQRVV